MIFQNFFRGKFHFSQHFLGGKFSAEFSPKFSPKFSPEFSQEKMYEKSAPGLQNFSLFNIPNQREPNSHYVNHRIAMKYSKRP
jgi:hypothetical protein